MRTEPTLTTVTYIKRSDFSREIIPDILNNNYIIVSLMEFIYLIAHHFQSENAPFSICICLLS